MPAGGRNVTALRYNKSSRSLSRIRPPRAHAVTLHSPDLEGANMPSRTLTPDLLPSPEPSPSPEPPPSVEPPPSPGPPPSPELPGLRLIKVPDAAPPYDCEIHGTACAATRDAADVGPRDAGPSPGSAGPRQAVTPGRKAARARGTPTGPAREASSGPAREASSGPAGATDMWPRQLAQVIVEILAGSRSPRQLIPLTTDRVRAQIGLLARSLGGDQRPRIKRVVTFRPAAGVLEMTVVVSFGPRSRALAMRFEHRPARPAAPGLPARPARWLCTDLEAG